MINTSNQNLTALVFPGQGSQIVGMGKDLFDNFASARFVFEEVDSILSLKLSKIMFEGPSQDLTKTENTQPALMAVSIALMQVLEQEFGKKITDLCSFVAGHSLGEYSALCAARAISLEDTAKLLQIRGLAMAKCGQKTSGAMAAILGVEVEIVEEIINQVKNQLGRGEICQIANDNSVGQIVISGSKTAILKALEIAKANGAKRAVELPVSGAFHSALMADAQNEMQIALQNTTIKPPIVPVVANITANQTTNPSEIKDLLTKQITGQVKWRQTMLYLEQQGISQIIEIGSGKVLSGLVARTCPNISAKSIQNLADIEAWL